MTDLGRTLIVFLLLASGWSERQALAARSVTLPNPTRYTSTEIFPLSLRHRQNLLLRLRLLDQPTVPPDLMISPSLPSSAVELAEPQSPAPHVCERLYIFMSLQR